MPCSDFYPAILWNCYKAKCTPTLLLSLFDLCSLLLVKCYPWLQIEVWRGGHISVLLGHLFGEQFGKQCNKIWATMHVRLYLFPPDQCASSGHTYRLHKVSKHMNNSSPKVDV